MRLVCALLLAWTSVVSAQQDDPDTEAARALFKRGTVQYDAGRFREALGMFEQAKAIKPLPAFDFNIATCDEQLGDWSAAIDAYERYLLSSPPDGDAVRSHVDELRRRSRPAATPPPPPAPPAPAPPAPAPPPAPPAHPGRGKTIAGGVIGGAGLILIAAGAATAVDGDQQADALTAADRSHRPFDPSLERRLENDRTGETALLVVGAAATATGVVLMVLGRRADVRARRYAWSTR